MSADVLSPSAAVPPRKLDCLVIRPFDVVGFHVVKNPRSGAYLKIGEQEKFLLEKLDGIQRPDEICRTFESQFHEPLSPQDFADFVAMVGSRGLLDQTEGFSSEFSDDEDAPSSPSLTGSGLQSWWSRIRAKSPLYFRVSLFDPDRLFAAWEPRLRWIWTKTFFWLTNLAIGGAAILAASNRSELVSVLYDNLCWETFLLVWVTAVVATVAHEFAHGLTCKHYGGEVHELGVLMMFFTPFFYCNVSDAWLFTDRRQRLWVSLAGSYFDLAAWAGAVFLWRLTPQGTLANYLAWIVLSTCGTRVLFNLNPLMRLDGYYVLSDWLRLPNLRSRGNDQWMSHVRWLLWGGPRPERVPRGTALLLYGLASWTFIVFFLQLIFVGLTRWLGSMWGVAGMLAGVALFLLLLWRLFEGFFTKEFSQMIVKRPKRLLSWTIALAVLLLFPIRDRASGPFQLRPVVRAEVRASVSGFLRELPVDEGGTVEVGETIARLEIPDLQSQYQRKQAEIRESKACLARLEAGTRPEELQEQRAKVTRAKAWLDLAVRDLERGRESYQEELNRLDQRISQAKFEAEYVAAIFQQAESLHKEGGLAGQQYLAEKRRRLVADAELQEAEARKRSREAEGLLVAEGEVARRAKELADTAAALKLLEAGSRPEDIEAERAHLARLEEECRFLTEQTKKQRIASPIGGLITTGRLKEKVGQYLNQGDLICVVEDLSEVEAEIAISEHEASVLQIGQVVSLKARAAVARSFSGKVERIATQAVTAEGKVSQGTMIVYCKLDNADRTLRTGMTGFGRVYHSLRPLGLVAVYRGLSYLRTEFWW